MSGSVLTVRSTGSARHQCWALLLLNWARMHGVHIDTVDHVPRPIIAIGTHYPDGHFIKPHQHRRGQLISGASGMIVLATPDTGYLSSLIRHLSKIKFALSCESFQT